MPADLLSGRFGYSIALGLRRSYHKNMNRQRARLVLVVAIVLGLFSAPVFAQETSNTVSAAIGEIAQSAGRLLPAALDLTPGSDDITFGIGTISIDNAYPVVGDLFASLIADELFARSIALRARRGIEVVAPPGTATLMINVTGTTSGDEAIFVVQVVENVGGTIRASARTAISLDPAIVAAFSPAEPRIAGTVGGPDDVPDDPGMAELVVLDSVVSGRFLEMEGDNDWYLVQVTGVPPNLDGIPALNIYTTGNTDTYIEVYGPDNWSTYLSDDDDGGESTNARVSFAVENNQDYWIMVRGFASSATGPYDLHVETTLIEPDPYEPNDGREAAVRVDLAMADALASIRPAGDADWYEVEVFAAIDPTSTDQRFVVETFGSIDTVMSVFDRNGNELGYNDDGGEGSNARVMIAPDVAGPIYVEVRGYGDWVEGDYILTAGVVEIATDIFEPDDTQDQARALEFGAEPQIRTFSSDIDVDWAVIEVDPAIYPEGVSVRAYTGGDLDTYVILYNEFGSELARSDDDGVDYNALIEQRLAPGRYFLEIYPLYLAEMSGSYTLMLEAD